LQSKQGCTKSEARVDFVSTGCGQLLCALHLQQEESDAWDLEFASTSTCKLCSMVISFWFQLFIGSYANLLFHVAITCRFMVFGYAVILMLQMQNKYLMLG